jgi:hypothetical protein
MSRPDYEDAIVGDDEPQDTEDDSALGWVIEP